MWRMLAPKMMLLDPQEPVKNFGKFKPTSGSKQMGLPISV